MEKKRTISPEHQAAMQAGRQKANVYKERMSKLSGLNERLEHASKEEGEFRQRRRKHRRKRQKGR